MGRVLLVVGLLLIVLGALTSRPLLYAGLLVLAAGVVALLLERRRL